MPGVMGSVGSEKNSNDLAFNLSVSHTFSDLQSLWAYLLNCDNIYKLHVVFVFNLGSQDPMFGKRTLQKLNVICGEANIGLVGDIQLAR